VIHSEGVLDDIIGNWRSNLVLTLNNINYCSKKFYSRWSGGQEVIHYLRPQSIPYRNKLERLHHLHTILIFSGKNGAYPRDYILIARS